ncbi:hypothetical protein DWU98_05055 [Dyella monticola]|uniref:Uncharacterized protein n=1 Tax=Dyella monticola TaxID=1927958 RepID=A0A370X669_9GAMM|nr:hypothetical protein [Dyella monticola]RDS83695.1 hypothetical protein DWU98_05055 [Dyella monticola]
MTFHFRSFWGMTFWFTCVMLLVALFVHGFIQRGDYHSAWTLGAGGMGVYAFLLYINIVTCSDLVITDDGVFRKLFGMCFLNIKWVDVKLITLNKMPKARFSDERTVVTICPRNPSSSYFLLRGRISVGSSIDGYAAFKRLMNGYIEKYQISVEIDDGIRITKGEFLE